MNERSQSADVTVRETIDLRVYRLGAIKKAAYRMAERCTVTIGAPTEDQLPIALTFRPGTPEGAARETARAFHQELLDQELREQVADETASLRALILAHAFSKTSLIK